MHNPAHFTPITGYEELQPNIICVVWLGNRVGAQEVGQQAVKIDEEEDQVVAHTND